jgi:hypothetical protein
LAPRTFEVEAEQVLPDDFWPGEPIEVDNRSDLERLMVDAATVLDRIGGTFSIAAVRRQLPDQHGNPTDLWVPYRFRAKWEPFAPGIRVQPPAAAVQEEPAPAPAPEPEPEVAELEPEVAEVPDEEQGDPFAADDWGPDAERALAAAEQG